MKIQIKILFFTLMFLFSGCLMQIAQEGATVGEKVSHRSGQTVGMPMNAVVILDRSLQSFTLFEELFDGSIHHYNHGKISVESSGAKRNPTGTLKAFALLRNRTNHTIQVQGRVQFFDEYKMPVEGPSAWQRIILPPNAVMTYKENSLGIHNLNHYYIELREGD